MHSRYRKIILFAILGGVVALVFLDPMSEKNVSSPSSPVSSRPHGPNDLTDADGSAKGESKTRGLALPERPALSEARSELFGSQSWQPPPPKIIAAPVAPTAPPLPYRFAGKLLQEGRLQVFLSRGDVAIPIKQDEILDGTYRVESIAEDKITLVYLPLGHKESISVSSSLQTAGAGVIGAGATAPTDGTQAGLGTIPTGSVIASVVDASSAPRREGAAAGASDRKAESKPAQLLWEGPQHVKLGTQFSVALRLTSDQAVHASPMQVRFDPALLESVAVKPGRFFEQGDRNFNYRVNPDGSIFIGASSPGSVPVSDAELLVLTFRSIKSASVAELSISSLNLQGTAGRTIAFDSLAAFKTAIIP